MCLFYTAICIPFPVLVLRTAMNGLSREMDQAARMGWRAGIHDFPAHRPSECAGAHGGGVSLQFTWIWNDLLFSTILATGPKHDRS